MRSWTGSKLNLAVACVAALGMLAFGVGSASAGIGHKYACETQEFCNPTPHWIESIGVAVDNSALASKGNVYVVEYGTAPGGNMFKYSAAGAKEGGVGFAEGETPLWNAVDPTTGDIYVGLFSSGAVEKFTPALAPELSYGTSGKLTGLTNPAGVAVDAAGNLFVVQRGPATVTKYNATGTELESFPDNLPNHVENSIAVDSEDNVYVSEEGSKVLEYPVGNRSATIEIDNLQPEAVAVDPSTDEVYISDAAIGTPQIAIYDKTTHQLISSFGAGHLGSANTFGIGINRETHDVYASSRSEGVGAFFLGGETPEEPETISPATAITGTSAELHGVVNPHSTATVTYYFEYKVGPSCVGGTKTTPEEVTAEEAVAVHAEVTGLEPNTEYTFCLVAENEFGVTAGEGMHFTSAPGAPKVEGETFLTATTTTAQVEAQINPNGAATTCKVEYGLPLLSEGETACPALPEPAGGTPEAVIVELTGLTPGKTYHWRFSATNTSEGNPTTEGVEKEDLKTRPVVEPKTGVATNPTAEGATLNGKLTTGTESAEYYFEYAKEVEPGVFGPFTKTQTLPFLAEQVEASVEPEPVSGLAPGTTYEFRLVAFPVGGSAEPVEGELLTFTTRAAAPVVVNKPPVSIGRTTASLSGEINTENSATEYSVEYGETIAYEKGSTPLANLPKAIGATTIAPVALSELHAGTIYHYRLVATNETGTTNGPDVTFTTAAPQLAVVEAESSAQVTQTTAAINATVNPNGLQTSYILEVGTEVEGHILYTPSFGEVGSGTLGVELGFALTGLQPGTTYHYRIVAQNEDGTVFGADQTFATPGFPPVILTPPPVQIVPTPQQPKEPKPHIETRQEKYKHAVALCKKKPKKKRAACLRKAKKQFGPVKKKGKKK
jgi:hypothetical protein